MDLHEVVGTVPIRQRRSLYQPTRRSWRRRIGLTFLVLFGFAFSGGIGAGAYFLPSIRTAFGDLGQKAATAPIGGVAAPAPSPTGTAAVLATSAATTAPLPGNGQPFTVLLLGSDNDSKFSSDRYLTQSMILCRVNPATQKVTMLSIPRDLYVPLSTGETDKIDKAYLYGGASAAIATVENNFHVQVNYYAWIGLQGLVKLIDDVGGIDVVATNPVLDDAYPADLGNGNPYNFQRVFTWPGPQHMDGIQAMEYVRSRHGDLRGDFGRSARQQQVLIALRAKAKLLGPANLPDLVTAIQGNFTTSMTVSQVASLLPIAGSVPLSSITQVVLGPPYTFGETIGAQDVVMPNWELIDPEVARYFPVTS